MNPRLFALLMQIATAIGLWTDNKISGDTAMSIVHKAMLDYRKEL